MVIDFKNIEMTKLNNFYGGTKDTLAQMHVDDLNRIMQGKLVPGASIGMHKHETGSEIIYVLSGSGRVIYDGVVERVLTGSCHYCPKGHEHSLINDGEEDLMFFAVVAQQ